MFKEIDVKTFDLEIFNKLNKEWALLSAGNKDAFNTDYFMGRDGYIME